MIKNYIYIIILLFLVNCQFFKNEFQELEGFVYGTYFKIKYLSKINYQNNIYNIFNNIDNSLSNYSYKSDLYKINHGNKHIYIDNNFKKIFLTSKEIFKNTNGAFDPTLNNYIDICNIIKNKPIQYNNFNKVFIEKNKILKPKNVILDFNGITKGYVVDLISDFFNKKNISNYLIEIGGEIKVKGKNKNKKFWKIGIETPIKNKKLGENIIKSIILKNQAIATSGCYRNFIKIPKSSKRYSHIINYKTRLPITNKKLLSVSVITKECIMADAYATAFMVLGIKKSEKIIKKHKNIHALFIYKNNNYINCIFI